MSKKGLNKTNQVSMATIINLLTQETTYLHFQHTFGRGNDRATQISSQNVDVSSNHAVIYWREKHWYLKDQSRNGTLINRAFLHKNTTKLKPGDIIKFGNNPATKWQVVDLAPPQSYLRPLRNNTEMILLDSYKALPNGEQPEITLFYTSEKQWKLEKAGETYALEHQQIIDFAGQQWLFVKNEWIDETVDYGIIKEQAYFLFTVSTDQEKITIQIVTDDNSMNLGERSYNYLLMTLAQKRQKDVQEGVPPKDQGWTDVGYLLDELSKEELKEVTLYNFNVRIHRLKEHLFKLQPYGKQFMDVLERRKGEIRFNHPNIKFHW